MMGTDEAFELPADLYCVLPARLEEACAAARRAATAGGGPAEPLQAADFGCGSGRWLGALAARCDRVLGLGAELRGLVAAAASVDAAGLGGRVQLLCRDAAGGDWPLVARERVWGGGVGSRGQWPWVHVAVCANDALASPDPGRRHRTLSNLSRSLRPGGVALLLVRAAESAALVERRRAKLGWPAAAAAAPPKHHMYGRDELLGAVAAAGLQLEGLEPVEQPWSTAIRAEGAGAAAAKLGGPNPFLWLAIATQRGGPNPFGRCAAAQWELARLSHEMHSQPR
jgi:SAM-dependent methyltransferase